MDHGGSGRVFMKSATTCTGAGFAESVMKGSMCIFGHRVVEGRRLRGVKGVRGRNERVCLPERKGVREMTGRAGMKAEEVIVAV